jgi:hypothetical protein
MKLYLAGNAPDEFLFEPAVTWLQIRGARGAFDITRLEEGDFIFREAVLGGQPICDAAERALDTRSAFDPGQGLSNLLAEGLVTSWRVSGQGNRL